MRQPGVAFRTGEVVFAKPVRYDQFTDAICRLRSFLDTVRLPSQNG
jgi:hypothetical protein